jgi:two-component system response regulator YesN
MAYNLLVVDDDAEFRFEFCECFEEYDITQAPDGESALNILKKPNSIDLVLLDVMMPGLRGTDVLAEMKKIKPDIKIIMLTGSRSKDVVIDSLKNKADEYIEKPMNVDETRQIIIKMLGDKETEGVPDTGDIKAKIEKVKKFVARNFDKMVSLEAAAEHAGLNAKYLSRVFEEIAGMGFSDFKSDIKVKKAKELLKQGFNINQISDRLGYQKTESFIRTFKKLTGFTPALFRDKNILLKKKPMAKKKANKKTDCNRSILKWKRKSQKKAGSKR